MTVTGVNGGTEAPAVIFLHIGKTAGTTMRRVLRRQYPASAILWTRNRTLLPVDEDESRLPRERTLAYFAGLPEEQRRRASLIIAHTVFGVHDHIPRPSTYITLLRNPVALTLSQYSYIRGTSRHRLHDEAMRHDTVESFIASGVALQTDNSQTRAISGDTMTPFGGCTPEMLATAKANIEERFSVVGLTERFDETLLLLQRAFGWRNVHYVRANVTPAHRRPPLPESTRRAIEEQNRFDMDLYAWASARFEDAIRATPGFDESLRRFRQRNRLYRPWGHLTYTIPKKVAARVRARRT